MRPDDPWRPLFPSLSTTSTGGGAELGSFPPPSPLLFLSFLFLQEGSMDLTKVGEKILSSVRSARSLSLLPPSNADQRPEVPQRAVAAAAVARALAGIPPHHRIHLPSTSAELISIYGSKPSGHIIEDLEEEFYEEDFDAVRHILENIPPEEDNVAFFEKKSTLRLAQLDGITERLSRHVMEHHEQMVKGMQLIMEVQQDLKIASVICLNGRRCIISSMNEMSRDLVVTSNAKKKQFLLDVLPILTELRNAVDMRMALEVHVEEGNYFKAFQVLSEYLQVLESFSELSAVQEMSLGIEVWLSKTLQKLDSLLLSVCQEFKEESYRTVVDAYALIGDIGGLAEKIQSFFMQVVLSETHSVLKDIINKDPVSHASQGNRETYSDLCLQIPESKFRHCLLNTLGALFRLMCSYYAIMSFKFERKDSEIRPPSVNHKQNGFPENENRISDVSSSPGVSTNSLEEQGEDVTENVASTSDSPFDVLRNDAIAFVAQTLQRGRKNLWQLTTSRVSVLLSCSAVGSASTHQFLRNYEDLNVFILAGEAFCGVDASEFRHRLKVACESYLSSLHRQNVYALKLVLEKETWSKISPDTRQVIGLAGLLGDGAPLIVATSGDLSQTSALHSTESSKRNGFSQWLRLDNPFYLKLVSGSNGFLCDHLLNESTASRNTQGEFSVPRDNEISERTNRGGNAMNGKLHLDDENEDLLADYIDEDSQLPSRLSKSLNSKNCVACWNDEDITAHTGSSLCLLRLMDKYARLMQKLEIVNVEFFKGVCQLFELFFHFIYETFGQSDTLANGKGPLDLPTNRLKIALAKAAQDCDLWIKPQIVSCASPSTTTLSTFSQMDVTPTSPTHHASTTSFGLKERCVGAETISLVAHVLHKSKSHLQSMLMQHNAVVEDFYAHLVDAVPDLVEHIHRTTARILLHINGYVDRIANAKWEIKDLGLEHNGYVDLLLGEFKHYKTRLVHGGIQKEVEDLLVEYGLQNVAETLTEGLSRVKRCTDEGRALMSLDLQVLINGLQHLLSTDVKLKMQIVDTFIKAYYLPETEFVHWAHAHPEYSKSQVMSLVNLVATMKSWKRKSRLEVLERIEAGL